MLENSETILKGIVNKDKIIIETFIKTRIKKVIAYAKGNGGSYEDGQDLMQESMIVLYNIAKKEEVSIDIDMDNYFFGIYRNVWIRKVTSLSSQYERKTVDVEGYNKTESLSDEINVEKEITNRDKYKLYLKHLKKLGEICQRMLKLLTKDIPTEDMLKELNYTKEYFYKMKSLCKKRLLTSIMNDPIYSELI